MANASKKRVVETPAFVLHTLAWSENSVIAHVFSRDHGLVHVVAKSAKRPYSVLRPILMHFQPLCLSWSGQSDIKTLTRAEYQGICPVQGAALMSAWYMNELLLRFLPLEDPHPELYHAYEKALIQLAAGQSQSLVLREFEWVLLQSVGYGFEGEKPNFEDPQVRRDARQPLQERIAHQLETTQLHSRKVALSLMKYKK